MKLGVVILYMVALESQTERIIGIMTEDMESEPHRYPGEGQYRKRSWEVQRS